MRFRFKSLLILSQRERRVGRGTEITTVYDLRNIVDHTFDEPTWKLWFSPFHLLATPLIASPLLGLAAYMAYLAIEEGLMSPGWWPLVIFVPLALFYPLSLHILVWRHMKAQALRERLLADSTAIHMVEEKEWKSFVAGLKQLDEGDRVQLLRDQLARFQQERQPPKPLPDDKVMRKWDEQAGKTEDRPQTNDQITSRRDDVTPGSVS
jgi:hypothetical protein